MKASLCLFFALAGARPLLPILHHVPLTSIAARHGPADLAAQANDLNTKFAALSLADACSAPPPSLAPLLLLTDARRRGREGVHRRRARHVRR